MENIFDRFPGPVMDEKEVEKTTKELNKQSKKIWFENMLETISIVRKDCDKMEKEILELLEKNDDGMMDKYLEKNYNHYLIEINIRMRTWELLDYMLENFPFRK